MSKATLTILNVDAKKLYVASRIKGVKLGLRTPIGPDESLIEVDFRDPKNLYETGVLMSNVKGTEFDAADAEQKKKADEAKAKAAAAKK